MKIFKVVQKHYAVLGISSSNQSTPKYPFNDRIIFGFLLYVCVIASQLVYIFYVANEFMEYIESICSTSGTIITFVGFMAIAFKQPVIFGSIDNLENFIETKRKHPKAIALILKTDHQVDRLCEIIFMVVVKISLQFAMLPKCITSFGAYFMTDLGRDSFELPLPMWFPFDTNNPIGYLFAVIMEYIILGYAHLIITCTSSLGIGAYWFATSVTKEIQRILHLINDKAHANKMQPIKLKKLFTEYVVTHVVTKQLIRNFSDIYQPIIMMLFTWSLLVISCAFFIIQLEILHHGNLMPLLLSILCGAIGLALVFIACEIGQRMSNAFEKIEFAFDQFDWYLFPIEIKRMLPVIIAVAQQPVEMECFGSINCTRDVFKNVIHHAFSYSMVLRQLGN